MNGYGRTYCFGCRDGQIKRIKTAAGTSSRAEQITVAGTALYDPAVGYGFVTGENYRQQELLRIPEINSGFVPVYWAQELGRIAEVNSGIAPEYEAYGQELIQIGEDDSSCYIEASPYRLPLIFRADVARKGNYLVTVTIKAPAAGMAELLIFIGRRRLVYRGSLKPDEVFNGTFAVNTCDIIPRGKECLYEEKAVTVTVVAEQPQISALRIEEGSLPTVFIVGDSTVTDQPADYPYYPEASYAGWGQMLGAFLDHRIALSNHAHSGLTTESFRKEGHYAIVRQYGRPGDYLILQFGHNDQKLWHLRANEGYRDHLRRYIEESRNKAMFPLLVTPVARNSWKGSDDSYNDLLLEYADSCLALGKETDVPVLDLRQRTMDFITGLGLTEAKRYFYPGDFTHSNDYGAFLTARFAAQEIRRVCTGHPVGAYAQLAGYVREFAEEVKGDLRESEKVNLKKDITVRIKDISGNEKENERKGIKANITVKASAEWIPPAKIALPEKPLAFAGINNPEAEAPLFSDLDRPADHLCRAEALELIIQAAKFFQCNVYNDIFTDVIGHEWYAGIVECAWQNGIIPPEFGEENHFHPERELERWEFLVLSINGYKSRVKLPPDQPCEYDTAVPAYARPHLRAACSLGLISADQKSALHQSLSRREAAEICRTWVAKL